MDGDTGERMAGLGHNNTGNGMAPVEARRRSLLELAPLELDCMNTLWPIGEGTVREIRDLLAPRTPRAYTTIMTIMDRLARKGIVERRKAGRAYVYKPNLSADEARSHALGRVIESFFGGSRADAVAFLHGAAVAVDDDAPRIATSFNEPPDVGVPAASVTSIPSISPPPARARAAAASASGSLSSAASTSTPDFRPAADEMTPNFGAGERAAHIVADSAPAESVVALPTEARVEDSPRMDETLL